MMKLHPDIILIQNLILLGVMVVSLLGGVQVKMVKVVQVVMVVIR